MRSVSLFLRLGIGFVLLLGICWASASLSAWHQTRETINELFDTQQMLLAKRLLTLDFSSLDNATLPKTKQLLRHHRGDQDDDALAFAVFTHDGRQVMNDGDNGRYLPFEADYQGFHDGQLTNDDDSWRLVWLTTPDKQFRVVVGQEWEYRDDMTRDLMNASVLPWLIALPFMLLLLISLVWSELRPLKQLAQQLAQRAPDDGKPLKAERVPKEVQPLVIALNGLFGRINAMIHRERRFTSDAAHELRSPLAALQVQSEVIQLAADDETMRTHALKQLDTGIARATRLVDQLLTLSRVEADDARNAFEPVSLKQTLQEALAAQLPLADKTGVTLRLHADADPQIQGNPLLLSLLVRNLLDNAIRYTPAGSEVDVRLQANSLSVEDNGDGLNEADLQRLGERFWRPPGQEKSGSGLGLSIVRNIAQLHAMQLTFSRRPNSGLCVTLRWS
ncbi:two-component system sensor histidine kinase QseC [Pantoea conspicua]|uniref:Sensor protein QseC n=1 Tax=Pantoea conspicua TaxID=472705 RepID=A0A1X1BU63_9GAMM|nr:quorum sensing histidine kinase QseC [Pantoea conspicua]ORM51958.1 two-component system sensor histidine kinase QseC [Pantoea conspicua]